MTRLQLNLPDDLSAKAQKRAAEAGHSTLEQYVQALIRADAEGPEGVMFHNDSQLAALLKQGAESGAAGEISDAQWQRRRQDLISRQLSRQTP